MKQLLRHISFLFLLTLLAATTGCQQKKAECPFTTITWEDTLEDIMALEGSSAETYESIYDGTTYTFPKEYDGLDGTIKYSFDSEEKLVSLSWMYIAKDSKDLEEVYDKLHSEAEDMLGESGFQFTSDKFADLASPGDVWYLEDGNILINTVDTADVQILQYTFLHPDVSEERPQSK